MGVYPAKPDKYIAKNEVVTTVAQCWACRRQCRHVETGAHGGNEVTFQ